MEDLVAVLGRERQVLETLLFRLVEARCLLHSREGGFLGWAAADVDGALHRLAEAELERGRVVRGLQRDHVRASLATLIAAGPEPFASMLDEHRVSLSKVVSEVLAVGAEVRSLAAEGLEGGAAMADDLDAAIVAAGYRALHTSAVGLEVGVLVTWLR